MFGDELNYWDMARSFHQGARIPYWSVNYDVPTQLYSFLLSPVFVVHRLIDAYGIARLVNPFLMASVVFPAYLMARELVDRRYEVAVAIVSVATPSMAYSSTLMTENLFYPLFIAAFWSAYRTLCWGRARDAAFTAFLFLATYYTKPHVFVLIIVYGLCILVWLVMSLRAPTEPGHNRWQGFGVRLIPFLVFAVALAPRALALPPGQRQVSAVLFGKAYEQLLHGRTELHVQNLFEAWSGLLLATLVATLFVPFAAFVVSAFRWKRMEWRQRWFWLMTALVWVMYMGLTARHTVLNDGTIRVHERYLFMTFPLFFVWYFLTRDQQSRAPMGIVSLAMLAVGAASMRWPAHVFLTPHLSSDSPSLTGFLGLAWIYHLNFAALALLVAVFACAATLFAFQRRLWIQAAAWTLMLASLSAGWILFQNRWVTPVHVRMGTLAQGVSSQVGPQATVAMLLNGKNWLPQFHFSFWMERPTILYGVDDSTPVPGSFNRRSPYVRPLARTGSGGLGPGSPAPDYLISDRRFSEPLRLVALIPANNTLYLYRIPPDGLPITRGR